MSVSLILNLLNELNKSVLCEPLVSIIKFKEFNKITNLLVHKFNILCITLAQKELIIVKKTIIFPVYVYSLARF